MEGEGSGGRGRNDEGAEEGEEEKGDGWEGKVKVESQKPKELSSGLDLPLFPYFFILAGLGGIRRGWDEK